MKISVLKLVLCAFGVIGTVVCNNTYAADADATGTLRTDIYSQDGAENYRVRNLEIDLMMTPDQAEAIKIQMRLNIHHALNRYSDGKTINPEWDTEKFLERAYVTIDIDKLTGKAVVINTVSAGKMEMPFGVQTAKRMLDYHYSSTYDDQKIDEVFGVATVLTPEVAQMLMLDKIELAVFETARGDFTLGDSHGFTIRLTKAFTDKLKAVGSVAFLDYEDKDDSELRTSLALIYKLSEASEVYLEWLHFQNNPVHPDTENAVVVGYTYKINKMFKVVIEGTYLDGEREKKNQENYQLSLGLPVTLYEDSTRAYGVSSVVVGPSVRFGDGGDFYGVRGEVKFGVPKANKTKCPDKPAVGDPVPSGCPKNEVATQSQY